jgi:branched-chain amino acid transport system substrate-binding protein
MEKRPMKNICIVFSALLALAALPAEAYEINVVLPLTGSGAFLGEGERQSLELVQKSVNKSGGLKGEELHFVFHDDQSSPQVGVQLASEIMAKRPAVLLGSSLVAICRAIMPLVKAGPMQYCFSPGLHPDAGSFSFTASVSTLDLADAMIRYFRLKGWTRLAIMVSSDATGQDAEDGLKQVLARPENKALQVVTIQHFNINDVSVSAQIENVKGANPQAFIAWSTGTPIATIFRAMLQSGLDVPTATTDGNMTYAQMTQYADFLPRQLYIPAGEYAARDAAFLPPAVREQNDLFYKLYASIGQKPDEPAELAWEPGMVVAHALRALGTGASAEQIRDFLVHLKDYAGVDGIYDFEKVPQRGLDVSNAVVTLWNKNAKTWEVVSKPAGEPLP